ncbi:eCIS core domain-containing protein [Deinococcus sp. UYEF24]
MQKALDHPGDPLPLSVRARLAPVMGRELGAVRLLQNAEAAAATTAAAADALAYGDKVLLSPGQDLASPRGLGLLAHELTHVLRGRDPGYVPPVARQPALSAPVTPAPGQLASARPTVVRPGTVRPVQAARLDEEGLAEYVEAQVRHRVQAAPQQAGEAPRGLVSPTAAPTAESPWGSLPAPWEPMPFWDTPVGDERGNGAAPFAASDSGSGHAASSPMQASASQGSAGQTGSSLPLGGPQRGTAAPVAQAASSTRSVDSSTPTPAPSSLGAAVGSDRNKSGRQAPDLDRLAQQVYGLIKRRLATETRRDH